MLIVVDSRFVEEYIFWAPLQFVKLRINDPKSLRIDSLLVDCMSENMISAKSVTSV
jgi:hypothetical protein